MEAPPRPRALAWPLALALAIVALLALSSAAQATGTPDLQGSSDATTVLHGETLPVHLEVTNPPGDVSDRYGYNLSFSVVLPKGVSYDSGGPSAPTVIADQPASGKTTLIFSNVADISPNSSYSLDFTARYDTSSYDAGDTIAITAQAAVNNQARFVPSFGTTGQTLSNESGSASLSETFTLKALRIEKREPSAEGEIMRGVHREQTTYTITVTNNKVNATDGVKVVDYLPADLEYLGCGTGVDDDSSDHTTNASGTNPGSVVEYPGSGQINVGAVAGCLRADSVETVDVDPDGAATPTDGNADLPRGVYTKVTWTLNNFAAGRAQSFTFAAAIPIRENTMTWSGGAAPALDGAQATNLDNNNGPETTDEQLVENYATASGTYHRNDGGTADISGALAAEAWLSRTAEDWVVHKSADTDELD
jgi:hypothetical protein